MRIALNGRFLSQRVTGVQRHSRELVRALDSRLEESSDDSSAFDILVLMPPDARPDLALRRMESRRVGRLRGQLWEQVELPFYARGRLLLNLGNTAPLLASEQVLMIHDASVFAVPEAYSPGFGRWYRLMLPRWAAKARLVLTNSEFSRGELVRWLGIPREKIRVVGGGHEHILRTAPDSTVFSRNGLGSRPYVLAVSSLSRNKNIEAVSAAIRLLGVAGCDYVIAGPANSRVFGYSGETLPNLIKLGYVTDGELRALYQHAACLVYPSRYEGFGFPPLEAMACECPVIVSETSSLPEVCGEAALYVNPDVPAQLATAIRRVLCEEGLSARLRMAGLEQAKQWTWERSAGETLTAVREASVR